MRLSSVRRRRNGKNRNDLEGNMHKTKRLLAALLTLFFLAFAAPASAQGNVLRFVQNGNLTILDPIWTTAYVTRNHGYFIYDTLFATDANNAIKPQMVEKYEVSPDKTKSGRISASGRSTKVLKCSRGCGSCNRSSLICWSPQ